jgi:hypothetical protein
MNNHVVKEEQFVCIGNVTSSAFCIKTTRQLRRQMNKGVVKGTTSSSTSSSSSSNQHYHEEPVLKKMKK